MESPSQQHHKRWEVVRYEHEKLKVLGIDSHLVSPAEIKDLCPIIDTRDVIGGLFVGNEGNLDPYGSTHAPGQVGRMAGAEIYLKTMVTDLVHKPDGSWTVVTDKGNIHCEHVVHAADVTTSAVRSYRTISPLPDYSVSGQAVYFLLHFP